MRAALVSALLVLAPAPALLGGTALAAPAVSEVKITIGPALAKKADELGTREFDILSAELRHSVERRLPQRPDGGTLSLVIDDAKPNRPTPGQLFKTPGLSIDSFGVGGAAISGEYVNEAGERTAIAYSWWESDIRWAKYGSTWHDAETAFDRLADRLAKDKFDGKH